MNNYNAGLAPLVIVLILVAVVIVGGGVYIATQHSAKVATTMTPTASVASSATTTSQTSVSPIASKNPTPTKAPAVSVKFATVKQAVDSGKSVVCVGAWFSEKGPSQSRFTYTITTTSVKRIIDTRDSADSPPQYGVSTQVYTSDSAGWVGVLTWSLSTTTCTQK